MHCTVSVVCWRQFDLLSYDRQAVLTKGAGRRCLRRVTWEHCLDCGLDGRRLVKIEWSGLAKVEESSSGLIF
ncbi:unnamed protein product [Calypogeia fissa]